MAGQPVFESRKRAFRAPFPGTFAPSSPHFRRELALKSKLEVCPMKGAEFWVLAHVIGQPDFGYRSRPFRALLAASNPHFCRELAFKSEPEVRLMKSAEVWVLSRVIGQPAFGRRGQPFQALLGPSNPHFC